MRAVDTNILVRLVMGDDPRQTAAAEQFVSQGAWVSVLALAEAVWVLESRYKLSRAEQADTVDELLDQTALVLQDSDAVAAALAMFRSKPALGFSDCLMLAIARKAGHLPLGTFDRSLGKADGAHQV